MAFSELVTNHERSVFYEGAPPITKEMIVRDHDKWWRDEELESRVVPIAFIPPTDTERAYVSSSELVGPCEKIDERVHLAALAMGGFIQNFRSAVAYDEIY